MATILPKSLPCTIQVTIPNGSNVSDPIVLKHLHPRGMDVLIPDEWTAADIGFENSPDGTNWYLREDAAGEPILVTGIETSAAKIRQCPADMWGGGAWIYLRLVSLDTGDASAENQGADRVLEVAFYQ